MSIYSPHTKLWTIKKQTIIARNLHEGLVIFVTL